jgi:hypothetical protein
MRARVVWKRNERRSERELVKTDPCKLSNATVRGVVLRPHPNTPKRSLRTYSEEQGVHAHTSTIDNEGICLTFGTDGSSLPWNHPASSSLVMPMEPFAKLHSIHSNQLHITAPLTSHSKHLSRSMKNTVLLSTHNYSHP